MGGGSWTKDAFTSYSNSVGRSVGLDGTMTSMDTSAQQMFRRRGIDPALKPYNAMRECRETKEHPNTIPVILALDVTGSMGSAAMAVAKKLNVIMTDLYNKVKDVEFMVMGIGDLAYDGAPVGMAQLCRQRNKAAYTVEGDESPVAPGEPLQGRSVLGDISRERAGGCE